MKKHYLFFSGALVVGLLLGGIFSVNAQQTKAVEKIKFLVISEAKDVYYSLSQSERKRIEDETNEYIKKAAKAGKILEFYSIPGWNRRVSIEQYESIEELYNHFEGDPIYPYIRFEIYPLKKEGFE